MIDRSAGAGWRRIVLTIIACLASPLVPLHPLGAQISPNLDWRTLTTAHFYVHFAPPLEPLARRIGGDAERAYAQLARELHPPRGMIDIVISDDVDLSNGSATPAPSNRIVIYANPPVSESALRFTNDWGQLVVTHELTHIFHLDRTRGIWALGQKIFGRAPALFPNVYSPSWLTEGIAVYYESRLAGAGRIEGSEHRMIARSAAIDHSFPAIGAVSLAAGRFPFGESAYAYGSLFVDYLARSRGERAVGAFIERSSAALVPYLLNTPARQSFGVTFSRAWEQWRDSIARSTSLIPDLQSPPIPRWRQLTADGVFVYSPRWLSDSGLVYSGTPGRESFGAYEVTLSGRRERVGRRNSRSSNVILNDGSLLYAQLDFVNPYQDRSDLWIQRGGRETRLTVGKRLTAPDARADGEIVAAQIIPGGTRLVRVSPDGRVITPITTGGYDEQWTEPRWSRSGTRIAATRWLRGDISQIVVLDTVGRVEQIVSSGHSVEATPSWLPGDSGIMYGSDRNGVAELYLHRFVDSTHADAATEDWRVSKAVTGLFEPQLSPRSSVVAAVRFASDGYHLGVGACCAPDAMLRVPRYFDTTASRTTLPIVIDSGPVTNFSPWRTLAPRYWLPTFEEGIENGYRIGGMTGSSDVVGRHAMAAALLVPTNNTGITGGAAYRYAGFGLPIIDVDATQDWVSLGSAFARDANRTFLGQVRRRVIDVDGLATLVRQRSRTATSVTAGVGIEQRKYMTTASVPLSSLDTTGGLRTATFPTFIVGAGYANYQFPPFAFSPEDGGQVNVTLRDRLYSGVAAAGPQSLSAVGVANLYKSLDLPGYAHHVFALRAAAGFADERSNGYYEVGGTSGSTFEIVPGYTVGEGRRTFGVRGFPPGTLIGIRALAGSAEYRMPLLLSSHGLGVLPFFISRSSISLFTDYGTAWCPSAAAGREVCLDPRLTQRAAIASAGAELNLNAALLSWDSPYRFRFGVVTPYHNGGLYGQPTVQAYFAAGVSF
jgi:hypothetical protein